MTARRPGVVLAIAVLVLMAVGALSTGLLFISTQQARIARASEDVLRARTAAESGVRWVIAGWRAGDLRGFAVGSVQVVVPPSGDLPRRVRYDVSVERLADSLFLVRSEAAHESGARSAAGAVLRVLDPYELWRTFPAGVAAGSAPRVEDGAEVLGGGDGAPPDPWPPDVCPVDVVDDLRRVFGDPDRPAILVGDGAQSAAGPPYPSGSADPAGADDVTDPLRLGPLGADGLRALADRVVAGSVRPEPMTREGDCALDAPTNWGEPSDPTGPCGNVFPLIFAPGDLHVTGGAGQGVLVVQGDLTLSGGARFYGPILVDGRLRVTGGAATFGAVTVRGVGPHDVELGSRIAYSGCAVRRALFESPGLARPLGAGGRVWIPLF